MLNNYQAIFGCSTPSDEDSEALRAHATALLQDNEWAREEALVATADYLRHNIDVYMLSSKKVSV